MKTRNLVGGAIVVAFVAGGYLGGLFPKFGTGTGFGPGSGAGTPDLKNTVTTVSQTAKPRDAERDEDRSTVMHVRIDGRAYAIVRGGKPQPMTLEQVVEQVQHYPGDAHGIRVRVSRLPNSKTTAELQLRDALVEAGLAEEAIDWQDGPRP